MVTVPAQSFCAPALAWLIAAARLMPGVCRVLVSSSPARTIRTPCVRQSGCPLLTVSALLSQRPLLASRQHLCHTPQRQVDAPAARDQGGAAVQDAIDAVKAQAG